MLQAILSGHYIVTTLHAVNARAIPRRFTNMCATGYNINEEMVADDIVRYVDFGIHIKKTVIDGRVIRYLNEMVEFSPEGTKTLYSQTLINGEFIRETGEISDEFRIRMAEKDMDFQFLKHKEEAADES
jgi:pilus assembly protein CpaF